MQHGGQIWIECWRAIGRIVRMKKRIIPMLIFGFYLTALFNLAVADEFMDDMLDNREFNFDDSGIKPWEEDQLKKLKVPDQDKMRLLDIDSAPSGFKVYIDMDSISLSPTDRVIRYWLMLKAGKSSNIMYEGMKCTDKTYKTYAYVNKWKKDKININKLAAWQNIASDGQMAYRNEFYQYYFCSDVLPRPIADIKDIIKGNKSTVSDFDPTYLYAK